MIYILVFAVGAILGSFLNVCIYRLPLGRSIVGPRSFCPFCEKTIGWFDNIPLVSYAVLRGRCRNCGRPIPARYPVVELMAAVIGVTLFHYFSLTPELFMYGLFSMLLVAVTFIDIEHQEIPDVISIPGILAGIVMAAFFGTASPSSGHLSSLLDSILGVAAGGTSMFLLGMTGELIFRKEALGGGDVKLMAMIGAFLGWKLTLLTFFLAPVFGSGVGLFMKIRFHKDVIPYGPYLSLAAFLALLYGREILGYIFGT